MIFVRLNPSKNSRPARYTKHLWLIVHIIAQYLSPAKSLSAASAVKIPPPVMRRRIRLPAFCWSADAKIPIRRLPPGS